MPVILPATSATTDLCCVQGSQEYPASGLFVFLVALCAVRISKGIHDTTAPQSPLNYHTD